MSSYMSYLSPASWTRAQKNKADLEATNPTNPVLNDEDERFLERITSQEGPAPPLPERKIQSVEPTVITDDGEEKPASAEEQEEAAAKVEEAEESIKEDAGKDKITADEEEKVDDKVGEVNDKEEKSGDKVEEAGNKEEKAGATEGKPDLETQDVVDGMAVKTNQPSVDTSSTENKASAEKTGEDSPADPKNEAEKPTEDKADAKDDKTDAKEDKMTKSWASYLPSVPSIPSIPRLSKKKDTATAATPDTDKNEEEAAAEEQKPTEAPSSPTSPKAKKAKKDPFPTQEEAEATTTAGISGVAPPATESSTSPPPPTGRQTEDVSNPSQRAWTSYIPSLSRSTNPEDSLASAVAQGKKAAEKDAASDDEKEVSVLLDKLNLSAINNRVFSFSQDSQKVYQSFTVVLKDIVNGGPTAYEDLEKLIKENEGVLDNMFGNMPPFVQTLVKSLPTKVMGSLGPEVLAAMSEKPGADMQAQMKAESSASGSGVNVSGAGADVAGKKKQKRGKIPSAKALVTEQGAVASMLRNILNFLKVRFPAFVTGTNVLMSLAVFILLFVFWYCHKRGKEVRLLAEAEKTGTDVSEVESSDEEDAEKKPIPEAEEDSWIKEKESEAPAAEESSEAKKDEDSAPTAEADDSRDTEEVKTDAKVEEMVDEHASSEVNAEKEKEVAT